MTLEQKRNLISENKDCIIAALESVVDTYYNYLAPVTNDKNNIKTAMFKDKNAETFALEMKKDVVKYEQVLAKVKKGDTMDIIDIAFIGSALIFCEIRAAKQIESLQKAQKLIVNLKNDLQSKLDS